MTRRLAVQHGLSLKGEGSLDFTARVVSRHDCAVVELNITWNAES